MACLLLPSQVSPGRVHSATPFSALLPTQYRRKSLEKKKKKNCSGLPQSKTCCVVSTRPLFFQPASSCLAACTASMCCPVTMSFFSGGVQMECIRRGMLECVCGNWDPATEAVMGNVVFFTHLPLSLHYLHIFRNNPHEGVLENSFFAVFWCNFGSATFGRQSHCLNLSFLATPSVIAECPANSSKWE